MRRPIKYELEMTLRTNTHDTLSECTGIELSSEFSEKTTCHGRDLNIPMCHSPRIIYLRDIFSGSVSCKSYPWEGLPKVTETPVNATQPRKSYFDTHSYARNINHRTTAPCFRKRSRLIIPKKRS